ncbi:MAG: ATP-binding protein [Ruminococcaceae bacterium]|nr:ATP-binding protein [Oscillospiraceae bacterium]
MSYSKKTISKVMDEFRQKPIKARELATLRRTEIQNRFPDIKAIDDKLSESGFRIYEIISSGAPDAKERLSELEAENQSLQAEKNRLLMSYGYPPYYTSVKYECEKCHDEGYVGINMCSCLRSALNTESFMESGLGLLAEHQNFDNFDLTVYKNAPSGQFSSSPYDAMKLNYDLCRSYGENFSLSSPSMLFIGGVGLGKTHLSTSIGKAVIDKGFYVIYESAPNILLNFEKERFSKSSEEDDTEKYYECDLLIIDDLGTEFSNRISISNVYNIINTRLIESRPTIISTNLSYTQLEKQYERRIISRLFGEFKVLLFEGTDYRRLKKGV